MVWDSNTGLGHYPIFSFPGVIFRLRKTPRPSIFAFLQKPYCMNRIFVVAFALSLSALSACNDAPKSPAFSDKPKTLNDSLMDEVMNGHDVAMGKMGKLTKLEQQTQGMIDSISKLPAKARQAAAPYTGRLDSLLKDLKYAEFAMDKWMNEFNMDSMKNDLKAQAKYLEEERQKVTAVKGNILSGIQKADSVLRTKF